MIVAVTEIVTARGTGNDVCGYSRRMRWFRELSVGQYDEAVWSLR